MIWPMNRVSSVALGSLFLASGVASGVRAESEDAIPPQATAPQAAECAVSAAEQDREPDTRVVVRGLIDAQLRRCIERAGGHVVSATRGVGALVVGIPLTGLLEVAELDQVTSIRILGASPSARARLAEMLDRLDAGAGPEDVHETVAAAHGVSPLASLGPTSAASFEGPPGVTPVQSFGSGGGERSPQGPTPPTLGGPPAVTGPLGLGSVGR